MNIIGINLNRWIYILFGMIIMMFLGTVYSYSVFRHSIEALYNIGTARSGMPYMSALAFYALFMFLSGKYLERFKPRNIILFGGFLVSLGWILSSFAPNILILTITYGFISGAGVGIVYGVPMTTVAKWFPEKKGLTVGLVLLGFGLSPLITAPIASRLVVHYGVMNTFLILGIVFALTLPFLAFPFKYPNTSDGIRMEDLNTKNLNTMEMIQTKTFLGLYLNFIIGTTIGLMLIGITTSVGIHFISLEAKSVAPFISIFAICNGIGRPTFGWITDRLYTKKAILLSYSLIIFASFLLIGFGQNNIFIYIISFSLFWFNLGGWLSIAPTTTLKLYGIKYYSKNYGLVFTAYGIGAILGVTTSGIILDLHRNYNLIFYYVITLCILGILLTIKVIKVND